MASTGGLDIVEYLANQSPNEGPTKQHVEPHRSNGFILALLPQPKAFAVNMGLRGNPLQDRTQQGPRSLRHIKR